MTSLRHTMPLAENLQNVRTGQELCFYKIPIDCMTVNDNIYPVEWLPSLTSFFTGDLY